jgi:BirA family biotin operon repressor/biotin-[acetyl-CoA-carboxylase] ligase
MLSTNAFAHDLLAKTNPIDGTVIITDHQTAGKGQGGNSWVAESGKNITCSIIYHTSFIEARQPYILNMAVSNALFNLLSNYFPDEKIRIKWPNDILYDGKKIAGILIANSVKGQFLKHSVIGIGLNVNQEAFEALPNATSLAIASKKKYDLYRVLEQLCVCVERQFLQLKTQQYEMIRATYNERLFGRGRTMSWTKDGVGLSGIPVEVNANGQLVAMIHDEKVELNYGEIKWQT